MDKSLVYQWECKEAAAKAAGLPDDAFYNLSYADWVIVRDAYAAWMEAAWQEYLAGGLSIPRSGYMHNLHAAYAKLNPFSPPINAGQTDT